MKKYFLIFVLVILIIIPLDNINAQSIIADQSCSAVGGGVDISGGAFQTFTPQLNRLTKIKVNLNIAGLDSQTVSLSVYHGGTILAGGSQTLDAGNQNPTYLFAEKEVTPGDSTYKIVVSASGLTSWATSAGCYSGGTAYLGGAAQGYDFGFTTYGYNYEAPVENPPPATPAPEPTPTDNPSGPIVAEEPEQVGVSTVLPPKDFKAEDVLSDEGGAVKLSWLASDTKDIDGYKIFRSTEEKKGYLEISKVEKDKLEYLDPQAETDKTFFYFSRAYKGSKQSNSSNTASVASKDNIAPKIPEKFKISATSEAEINFTWKKSKAADLAGYIIIIYNPKDQGNLAIETIEISKDKISYKLFLAEHTRLRPNTAYDFSLQAKDNHNNLSEKTRLLTSSFGKPQTGPKVWYAIVAGVLVLASAGGLIILHRRRKRAVVKMGEE